ncbi:MAG: efflux RND transporter periplasmic adaptor subunit [Gammaproteobacteria bacterium]
MKKIIVYILSCYFVNAVYAQIPAKPPAIIASHVQIRKFADIVEALGTLRANETVNLTASVTEIITQIHFDDNQRVNKGDILVEMTSDEEHAQLNEAMSTVEEAQKQYERIRNLTAQEVATESLLDERLRDLQTAKARLKAIESRIRDRLIRAPFSGIVGLRNISPGTLIEPGQTITTLDDDSIMKLDFTVPAIYLNQLQTGIAIIARTPAFPQQDFKGTVSHIDSRVDPVTRSITIRAQIPNPNYLLRPGLLMTVNLLINQRQGLALPEQALIPRGKNFFVYLLTPEDKQRAKVTEQQVHIGTRQPGWVEITKGLKLNQLVVTQGSLKLRNDQQIFIQAIDNDQQPLQNLLQQNTRKTNYLSERSAS